MLSNAAKRRNIAARGRAVMGNTHPVGVALDARLSHATYSNLPPRFQAAARELVRRGELIIESPARV